MEKSKLFRTVLKSIFISAMALLLIFTASACSNQKEISWKSAADSSVGFNVPDEYELKSDDDGQLYTMGKNEIYVCDDDEEFDVYSINEETAYLKDQLGGEYEVVQIPKGYEAAHTVSNENDLITHKYAIREKTTRSYGMYDFKYEETYYNYFLFRIVIDPATTLLPEDEMLEQFWDRVIFNLYEDSEIVPILSSSEIDNNQSLSERDAVVEQFRDVLGSKEIDENNGYISNSETVQATMSYWENSLLDLLRPMAAGDWSNGQSDVYITLWAWINSSKQYYRSTVVEAYMNGETNYTIEQLGDMIEENDNELDDLFNETWETLSTAISLEYEDGIQAFIDGIEG